MTKFWIVYINVKGERCRNNELIRGCVPYYQPQGNGRSELEDITQANELGQQMAAMDVPGLAYH